MKKFFGTLFCILLLTSCDVTQINSSFFSNDYSSSEFVSHDLQSESTNLGHVTGPLILGEYFFEKYDELNDFYSIFKNKNTERYIFPSFDDHNDFLYYVFYSSGVHIDVINDHIYDYDFPRPGFEIYFKPEEGKNHGLRIELADISKYGELNITDDSEIIIKETSKSTLLDIYLKDYCLGTIDLYYCNNYSISDEFLNQILNKFMEVLKCF